MKKFLNNVKKLVILILAIMLILPNAIVLASNIKVGDNVYIERGNLGFYTIQYWSEYRNNWMYITYSRTYYTDSDGSKKIAYCMDPDLDGVGWLPGEMEGYDTTVSHKLTDERIYRILKNGYPNQSLETLGVETDDDGYLATKQAVYWVLRNRKLEDVYSFFRAGQTEINGQNLEDIQRRGKKVVDAIYKLVNIAYNQPTSIKEKSKIGEVRNFTKAKKEGYYSKEYKISNTGLDTTIEITGIEDKIDGTYIADINENEKNIFKSGENFKVMVPKKNIDHNYQMVINYKKIADSYPIYYTTSNISGMQNYIILLGKQDIEDSQIKLDVIANLSKLKIIKTDEETGEPIEGVNFECEYKNIEGNKKEIYTTDKDGIINIDEIAQGEIYVTEMDSNNEYEIDNTRKKFEVNYNEKLEIKLTNRHKKGNIEIHKVDKDNNDLKLEGVEFDLIDNNGNIVKHLITNENGEAEALNINTGNYTLKETKTREEYKIGVNQDVKVNWNETLKLKIENEKKKGQIKIIKTSEDRNEILNVEAGSPIQNVKFNIYNANNQFVEQVVTNEKGIAISSKLDVGEYNLQEVETGEWYILNKDKINTQIKEDGEVVEINVKNKSQHPDVEIEKSCKNTVKSNEEINYEFNISNTGNTELTDFTWYDILPSDYAKITKISTGTYNQDINYNIYYKTNKKNEYMVVKKDISSKESTYINLSDIYLEEGEQITELKICFGKVDVGFRNIEKPVIIMKVNNGIENNTKIKNYTILEGYRGEYKVSDDDTATSIIYNMLEKKKLPRTGY